MNTTLLIMAAGIGSRFGTGIKQLEPVDDAGHIIMDYSIHDAIDVMQKKGMYLGGYRPFGFLSDPNDCHKLILDPVASRYVRLIFELALQGNRTGTIFDTDNVFTATVDFCGEGFLRQI